MPVRSIATLVLLVAGLAVRAPGLAAKQSPAAQQRQMAAVVHEWSKRLNANDNDGVAKLFAVPAILIQGTNEYRLTTQYQISLWHSLLPCSGTVVSMAYAGRYGTAVFRLGNRGKSKCDAPGVLAAARFEIIGGKIVSWVQVPVPAKTGNAPVA